MILRFIWKAVTTLKIKDFLPAMLVAVLATIFFVYNTVIGMTWHGPGIMRIALITSPLLLLALYTHIRGDQVISEITTYMFLYFLFPMIGVKLSYLAATLDQKLIDENLAAFDARLGFDWTAWSAFNDQHPAFKLMISLAYASPIVQAVGSVVIFALFRNGQRNAETLFALVTAMTTVLIVCAFFPALGPQSRLGIITPYAETVCNIRDGKIEELTYQGIIWFPSYHTVMALIFIYGHRGLKYSFLPVLALNAAMLLAIPNIGCHYLADMFSGAAVAVISIVVTRWIYRPDLHTHLPIMQILQGTRLTA